MYRKTIYRFLAVILCRIGKYYVREDELKIYDGLIYDYNNTFTINLKSHFSFIYLRSFGRVRQAIGRLEHKVTTPARSMRLAFAGAQAALKKASSCSEKRRVQGDIQFQSGKQIVG